MCLANTGNVRSGQHKLGTTLEEAKPKVLEEKQEAEWKDARCSQMLQRTRDRTSQNAFHSSKFPDRNGDVSSSGASLTASHWSHEELGPADAGFIEV